MKKIITMLALLAWSVAAFAQDPLSRPLMEIAEVEINDGDVSLAVYDVPDADQHAYYLCVGRLGIGDDIVQIQIDPLFQLFIPLGGTLEEAQAKMEEFRGVANMPSGEGMETLGTLALTTPVTGKLEPVYLNSRRFIFQRIIEFSVKRDGYVRATHISRGNFSSLLSGLKLYRKIHPNEP